MSALKLTQIGHKLINGWKNQYFVLIEKNYSSATFWNAYRLAYEHWRYEDKENYIYVTTQLCH